MTHLCFKWTFHCDHAHRETSDWDAYEALGTPYLIHKRGKRRAGQMHTQERNGVGFLPPPPAIASAPLPTSTGPET
jgi:hypothetical protein